MAYFAFKNSFRLCCWKDSANVILNKTDNSVSLLSAKDFFALFFADGKSDSSSLSDDIVHTLEKYTQKGTLTKSEDKIDVPDDWFMYYSNKYIQSVHWSVTGRCNYRCRHCYMDAPDALLGEADTAEMLQVIDEMAMCGIRKVSLTGGEPLLRKDFFELLNAFRERDISVIQIYSNGALINESFLNKLETLGPKPTMIFSFDGLDWHDWMRGIKGAEEAAIKAIQLCLKRGFRVGVSLCLHRGNMSTFRETVKSLGHMGVHYIKVGPISDTDLWCKNNDGNRMPFSEYLDFCCQYIPLFYEDGMPTDIELGGLIRLQANSVDHYIPFGSEEREERLDEPVCADARYECYITPDLRLLPCMPITACADMFDFPTIKEAGGLKEALTNGTNMQFVCVTLREFLEKNKECAGCKEKLRCGGGCRASALLGPDHDIWGCDRRFCDVFEGEYPQKAAEIADRAIQQYQL